jgi:two-component system, OmpR family, sensor histidine kinase KdpD
LNAEAGGFPPADRKSRLGKLKIYLGHAAGVGKTYAMLEEAHRLKKAGVDVVIGWVETHGRKETEALLVGLEIIPRKKVEHNGHTVEVLDVDAIFKRYPTVCVVDELPFTNVAGSQHPKRYLEVHDLLLAGINIITAMNIQHLESLHDTVLRATGVDVRERVPDRFVLEADHVVNVDLTAEELRERLKLGKIYPKDRAAAALENFFTENNLNELRELALRETANALDQRPRIGTKSPPEVSEKSPSSSAPIRDDGQVVACGITNGRALEPRVDGGLCPAQKGGSHADSVGFAAAIHAERPACHRTRRQRHGAGKRGCLSSVAEVLPRK